MEQENNNKKMILPMILGITVLSILVLGATYAYFTVGTSNNFGSKTITANTPEIGNVALTSGESLSLNMTSELMMEENIGTYYATTTGVPSTTLVETDIATATVTGSGNFNCTYDLAITPSATNSLYTAFIGMTGHDSNQIVLKVGSTSYDFNTTDFSQAITIHETFAGLKENKPKSLKASLMFNNTNFNQNDLQGKDITLTFTASNLSCTAVDYTSATFDTGSNVSKKMKALANNNLSNITSFERVTTLPNEYESSEYEIQSSDSDEKIYMWNDNGVIKYYTEAGKVYLNENASAMFANLSNLISIDTDDFDTTNVTNMGGMFANCTNLTSLNLSNFDTSKVTSMLSMFDGARALTSLDLSSFDTSNVTNMTGMFSNASALTSLDLSSFNTSNVTNMTGMFAGTSKLTSLNLSLFNTSNVTNMIGMFGGCSSLTSLDLSGFDMRKVSSFENWLSNSGVKNINLTNWKAPISTRAMFAGRSTLEEINLTNADTSITTSMPMMFADCTNLTSLDLSSFNTSNVTDMNTMFVNCANLTTLDLSSFDISGSSNVNVAGMFRGMTSLKTIYATDKFSSANMGSSSGMFNNCTSLKGGNNTAYNSSYIDKTYARIDTASTPGYFTAK